MNPLKFEVDKSMVSCLLKCNKGLPSSIQVFLENENMS